MINGLTVRWVSKWRLRFTSHLSSKIFPGCLSGLIDAFFLGIDHNLSSRIRETKVTNGLETTQCIFRWMFLWFFRIFSGNNEFLTSRVYLFLRIFRTDHMMNSLVNLQFDTSRVAASKSNKTRVMSPKLSDVAKSWSHTDDIHSVETNGNYYVVHINFPFVWNTMYVFLNWVFRNKGKGKLI